MSTVITDTIQSTAELGTLDIPGLFPAPPGDVTVDGGLGLRNVETPQVVYLQTALRPSPGDLLELFSNDPLIPVAHTFVMPGTAQDARIPILLPASSIKPPLIDPLVCRNNLTGASTRPARLRVDLNLPGGRDPDRTTPGNQGFVFYLPDDVLISGVSEARARETIKIQLMPYPFMAIGDRVLLCWGDQQIIYSVTAKDLQNEITLVVPYETIMAARDSLKLPVRLQVRGRTGNATDPQARWSAVSEVAVYARGDLLWEPYVNEADPQTGVIDLEQLMGKSITASVFATSDYFEARDTLEFFFQATDAQGNTITHTDVKTVDRANKIFEFEIPHGFVAGLSQGHAKVSYALRKTIGGATMYSSTGYVSVQGPVIQWPAPYLNEVMPFAELLPEPIYAYVPYQATWKPWDLITLVWLLPDPEGTVEYRSSRSAGERPASNVLEFPLTAAQITRFEGRDSVLYYEANGIEINRPLLGESARKTLLVGKRWAPMAAPVVDRVVGHRLDPDLVPDGVWVTLPSPPIGQDVRLHWVGPGTRVELPVYVAKPGDVRVRVPARFVTGNLNRVVKVYWLINQNNVAQRYSSVVTLQILRRGIYGDEDVQRE